MVGFVARQCFLFSLASFLVHICSFDLFSKIHFDQPKKKYLILNQSPAKNTRTFLVLVFEVLPLLQRTYYLPMEEITTN